MFNKTTATVFAVIFTISAFAGDLKEHVLRNLNLSVRSGDAIASEKWAATLNSLEQAETAKETKKMVSNYNKVAEVYGNVIKSIPAALDAVEYYNSLQKKPDSELSEVLKLGRIFLNLQLRPLNEGDLKPVVKTIHDREEADRKRWEAEEAKMRNKYNRKN